jgi:PiT family inorganic phosphate transporter
VDTTSVILLVTLVSGLYLAWNMGANDVANAVGPSLGSRALVLWQAILVAAVFEALGAVFAGSSVTRTVSVVVDLDVGLDAHQIALGMCACLLASAIWLNVSSVLRLPASTTHAIVGALIGFGLLTGGVDAVHWPIVGKIGIAWVVSPLVSGGLAFWLLRRLRRGIFNAEAPVQRMRRVGPVLVGAMVGCLAWGLISEQGGAVAIAGGVGAVVIFGAIAAALFKRMPDDEPHRAQAQRVENSFRFMQALAVALITFAHGSNDVANAVGPLATAAAVLHDGPGTLPEVSGPMLIIGVVGIIIGIATYGYRVMSTVGREITPLTPSSGFSALLSAAVVILACSVMGLPVSTAHTIVGAIVGVGFARGVGAINLRVIRGILAGWALSVPVTAGLAAGLAWAMGSAG